MPFARQVDPWRLVLVGIIGGALGGGLGLGGGFIMVPLLVILGFDRHRSHATSLAAIFLIAVVGAISFGVSGEADLYLGIVIGVGGIAGSTMGAQVMHRSSPRAIRLVFSLALLAVSLRLIIGGSPNGVLPGLDGLVEVVVGLLVGVAAGLIAGLAGVGGGLVIVPASVFFLGLTQHEAQGTSLIAIVFTAISATLVNLRNGRIQLRDGLTLGAGGAIGSLIGSRSALALSSRSLSQVFGLAILLIALRSTYQAIRDDPQAL